MFINTFMLYSGHVFNCHCLYFSSFFWQAHHWQWHSRRKCPEVWDNSAGSRVSPPKTCLKTSKKMFCHPLLASFLWFPRLWLNLCLQPSYTLMTTLLPCASFGRFRLVTHTLGMLWKPQREREPRFCSQPAHPPASFSIFLTYVLLQPHTSA